MRIVVLFILVACRFVTSSTAAVPVPETRRVLILNEEGISFPGIDLMDREIRAALGRSPYRIELYDEFLQVILFPDETYQRELRESYIHKYRDRKPDLIIAEGASAIKFMVQSHQEFFPNTPIIICGAGQGLTDNSKLDSEFTGTWMTMDPAKTLEAALRLQPNTKHVVVVGGAGPWDRAIEAIVRESLRKYESKLEFTYLTDLAVPALLDRLKGLPAHTIIFYTTLSQDAAGTLFVDTTQVLPQVADVAKSPVFVMADTQIGRGAVGGYLTSYAAQGRVAGETALRILAGARPQDIPIVRGTNVYMFDWRALKRWRFAESNLQPGSTVLYRQFSVWESYRRYIIGAVFVVLAETLLILGLLWQRERKRKLEEELVVTNDRLRSAMESGKAVGWEWNLKTGRDSWFGDLKMMFGTESETHAWRTEDFYRYVHPEDRQFVREAMTNAKKNHKAYTAEFRLVWPDGAQRWVAVAGKFYNSPNGKPERMLGMAQDITERKRAEENVRESEERLRLAIQAGKMYAFEWDMPSDVIFRTGQCREILNWISDPTCDTGRQFVARVHPDDRESYAATETGLSAESSTYQSSYRVLRPDGRVIWLEESGRAFFDDQGRMRRIIGMVSDITERKLAEEALSGISRRLIEAQEQERSRIGRELHDDVVQRLALVAVELEQLSGDADILSEVRDHMDELQKQTSEIASDIQSMSHELHSAKLQYLGLATAVKSFCQEFSEQQKVEIDFKIHDVPGPLSPDVSLCFFRVLQEALHNSAKHSGVRHFQVRLWGTSDEIHLMVSDSGAGFDRDATKKGRGLGLISMEERLKLVNGKFSIESQPKCGTRIHAHVHLGSERDSTRTRTDLVEPLQGPSLPQPSRLVNFDDSQGKEG